jgi:PHD/YefM family antitoxin component YafN of YafNO toxin-antitoxin module
MEHQIDLFDLDEASQRVISPIEVTGERVVFTREGRRVGILVSWDEWQALSETVAISTDADTLAEIRAGETAAERNDLLIAEDLFDS